MSRLKLSKTGIGTSYEALEQDENDRTTFGLSSDSRSSVIFIQHDGTSSDADLEWQVRVRADVKSDGGQSEWDVIAKGRLGPDDGSQQYKLPTLIFADYQVRVQAVSGTVDASAYTTPTSDRR